MRGIASAARPELDGTAKEDRFLGRKVRESGGCGVHLCFGLGDKDGVFRPNPMVRLISWYQRAFRSLPAAY